MTRSKRSKFNKVIVALATITVVFITTDNNGFAENIFKTHIIEIRDLEFIPSEINVLPGDIVKWVNYDFIPHTATANNKSWDSELINAEAEWQMTVNNETIEDYFCVYHPGMKGKLRTIR